MMKCKHKKNPKENELGSALIFYGMVAVGIIVLSFLGGCARNQPVIVQSNIEPPRTELMQESKLPLATAEGQPLPRCVKNLATTRLRCGKIADNHNGLRQYVKEAVPSARRVD